MTWALLITEGKDDVRALREIFNRELGTSWKTAFRLLNAVRMPNTEDGFVARVFGQDRELRKGVRPVLESTDLWHRLQMLAGKVS